MTRLLLVSTNADRAGAPIHVATLVTELQADYELHCVFGEEGLIADYVRQLGVPVTILPTLRSSIHPWRDMRCLWAFSRLCQTLHPDLIHAHSAKAGMIARLIAKLQTIPCVYTVHGWGFGINRPRIQSALTQMVEWVLARISPAFFIYVSHADAQQAQQRLGIATEQGCVIHNGIPDHAQCAHPLNTGDAIMVARVSYPKDYETLCEAFEHSDVPALHLVGEGTLSATFQALIQQHAPTRYADICTWGLQQDVTAYLARVGIFTLASRYEGLPIAIIEAMRAGLPIVANDVGGVKELVTHGVNGFLVPVSQPHTFSAYLTQLQDPALRNRMGRASRERFETEFTVTQMMESLKTVYQRLLNHI